MKLPLVALSSALSCSEGVLLNNGISVQTRLAGRTPPRTEKCEPYTPVLTQPMEEGGWAVRSEDSPLKEDAPSSPVLLLQWWNPSVFLQEDDKKPGVKGVEMRRQPQHTELSKQHDRARAMTATRIPPQAITAQSKGLENRSGAQPSTDPGHCKDAWLSTLILEAPRRNASAVAAPKLRRSPPATRRARADTDQPAMQR